MKYEFKKLKKIIGIFEKNTDQILSDWISKQDVVLILSKNNINPIFFRNNYGINIVKYIIDVAKGDNELGNCPFLIKFLKYLQNKNVRIDELFALCVNLRRVMLELMSSHKQCEKYCLYDLSNEICMLFDENFTGVLEYYAGLLKDSINKSELSKEKLIKLNKGFEDIIEKKTKILIEYKHALDESSLVSRTDLNGIITYANDLFCMVSGYSEKELIGRPHNIVRHPDMDKELFKNLWDTIQSKNIWQGIIKNRRKNGDHYWVKATIAPILDSKGVIREYISIRTDITEQENSKVELKKSYEKLKLLDKAKDEFVGIASHELRTPLTIIQGYSSLMLEGFAGKIKDKQKTFINKIFTNTTTLIELVNDMLDVSKLKAGHVNFNIKKIDLINLIHHKIDEFTTMFYNKNISLSYLNHGNIKNKVYADEGKLKRVFDNLLSNAYKFSNEGGKVMIFIRKNAKDPSLIEVGVQDHGIGIPKNKQKFIFNKFKQVVGNLHNKKYEGSGLGLEITKNIISNMGGKISVHSEQHKGSTFIFTLKTKK